MPNHLRHFAITADDVERARRFYEAVFQWSFEPWGPPGFYLIHTGPLGDRGVQGALQERRTPLSGAGMRGFECTIGVDDLEAVLKAATAAGSPEPSPPFEIEGVGRLSFIEDTEGNRVGVMQYVDGAFD
jgi:predicted enzyme related to lactoylglutathione lyase